MDMSVFNEAMIEFARPSKPVEEMSAHLGSKVQEEVSRVLDVAETLRIISPQVASLFAAWFFLIWLLLISEITPKARRTKRNGCLFYLFAMLLRQKSIFAKTSFQRFVLYIFLFGVFFVTAFFYGQMSTDLLSKKQPIPIDTLEQLAISKQVPLIAKGSSIHSLFESSKNSVMRSIWSHRTNASLIDSTMALDIVMAVKRQNAVTIMAKSTQMLMERLYCQGEGDGKNQFHKGRQIFNRGLMAGVRRIDASPELGRRLDLAALSQLEFGLNVLWIRQRPMKVFPADNALEICMSPKSYVRANHQQVIAIDMRHVYRLLCGLLCALFLAGCRVLFEVILYKWSLKAKKEEKRMFTRVTKRKRIGNPAAV